MIKIAKPATFGWMEKTCLDSEVRSVWKIPKSRIKIDKRRWNQTLNPTLDGLKEKLGLPEQSRLRAELHDMLIYAPGQFFKFHQDSEKSDGMVATLVVVLPSPHSGGALIIEHQGEKIRYQSSRAAAGKLTFFTFYADCQHEVRPVTEGYRVALIYNLILKEGADRIAPPSAALSRQALTDTLDDYFFSSPKDEDSHGRAKKLVYLLDHQYTPRGLSWRALKNIDRLRASALSEVAAKLDLEIYLALADVQELWDCAINGPGWGYGSRRRYWGYDEDDELKEESDDKADVELLELIEDSTLVKHWRDAAGNRVDLPEWSVRNRELCWTKATDEFSPFESEHEGWMGNYGNTVERWYHRAAIVLWRRDERYVSLLEIAPEVMIRELLSLAGNKATRAQSRAFVRNLTPNWSGLRGNDTKPSSFNQVFRLALRLEDAKLARELLLPLGMGALRPATVRALIRLQTAYRTKWLIDVLQAWLDSPTYADWGYITEGVSPIVHRWVEYLPDEYGELTHWLMGRQLAALKRIHRDQARRDSLASIVKNAPGRIAEITDLLSAAVLSADDGIFRETIDHVITDEESYRIFDLVGIARYTKQQDHGRKATGRQSARLLKFVRARLTAVLESPPRKVDDWSIDDKLRCNCADCKVLATFLRASRKKHKVWPLAKKRRQHIHRAIDAMGIPVTHTTERMGSPHKLHLTKTKKLFLQERTQRVRLKEALDDLAT